MRNQVLFEEVYGLLRPHPTDRSLEVGVPILATGTTFGCQKWSPIQTRVGQDHYWHADLQNAHAAIHLHQHLSPKLCERKRRSHALVVGIRI